MIFTQAFQLTLGGFYVKISKKQITEIEDKIEQLEQNINDSLKNASELASLLKGTFAYVNLIPYNETNHIEFKRTSKEQIMKFYDVLKKKGVNVTIRKEFGGKIDAACGQLRSKEVKA